MEIHFLFQFEMKHEDTLKRFKCVFSVVVSNNHAQNIAYIYVFGVRVQMQH